MVEKSSVRQVHDRTNEWRVGVAVSDTPRLSSSSAIASASRDSVPRSMTFERKCATPGRSGGSLAVPDGTETAMVTAGVAGDDLAITRAPFLRRLRAGANPLAHRSSSAPLLPVGWTRGGQHPVVSA